MTGIKRRIPNHDTRARYNRGCRCEGCREAARLYFKRLRERRLPPGKVDSTGTARKLRSLLAGGWSFVALGERVGTTGEWLSMLANRPTPMVTATTHDAVEQLWQQLRHTPGPSAYARTWARKRGWPPPEFWDGCDDIDAPEVEQRVDVDMVAVERALKGVPVALSRIERHYAVHAGREREWTYTRIAEALRMSVSRAKELGAKPLPTDCEVAA